MTKKPKTISSVFEKLIASFNSEATQRGYRIDWTAYHKWRKSDKAVLDADPEDVERYIAHLASTNKAKRTRARALSVIRRVYGVLVVAGLLRINPAAEVKNCKQGKAGKKVTWLEEAELARFLSFGAHNGALPISEVPLWTDRRDRMCIHLLAGTGRRRAEIARMRVEDFGEDGVIGIVKGGPLADITTQLSHASRSTTEMYLKGSRKVAVAPAEWMSPYVRPGEVT